MIKIALEVNGKKVQKEAESNNSINDLSKKNTFNTDIITTSSSQGKLITHSSIKARSSTFKKLTNTKFVLQLLGVFLVFEFLRALLTLFLAF